MKWMIMILLLIAWSEAILPQTVKVIDRNNLQPIEHVLVYDQTGSVYTDINGEADIRKFAGGDSLAFYHSFYREQRVAWKDLLELNFRVSLRERVVNMNEVVVAASRWEQNKQEVPGKIAAVSARDVAFYNPQTSADLLTLSDQVFVQKSQMGGGSPMIRGFSANRVLIVVDGVRMNNAIYRSGNLQNVISLDANSIANSEVLFGPGSVIYGSDAIGGVMDFHTLSPLLREEGGWQTRGGILTRYASANEENTAHAHLSLAGRRWGSLTSVTFSQYGDLRMGRRNHSGYRRPDYVERIAGRDSLLINPDPDIQVPSGYDQINLLQKLRYRPAPDWDFSYGWHFSRSSDVPRYDRLIETRGGRLRFAEWYYGPQEWQMHALTLRHTAPRRLWDVVKLTAAYQNYRESRLDRRFGSDILQERVEDVDIFSLNLDVDKALSGRTSLFYGGEWTHNRLASRGEERDIVSGAAAPIASRYPDGADYTTAAAYLSFKSNLSPRFTVLSGVRYSHIRLNADFDKTFYDFPFDAIRLRTGSFNGSLGMVYRPTERWQFQLNLASGFRAPNIDDAGKVFDSEPGSVVVPNPDLASENAYSIDLGLVKAFGDRIKIETGGFYSLLRDAMVRRDFRFNGQDSILYDGELSRVQAIVNADEAWVYGLETALKAELSGAFALRGSFTYLKGEDGDGFPLRHVTPAFGSVHLMYEPEKFRSDLYLLFNGEIANRDLAPSEQEKPQIYARDGNGNPYSPAWFTLNFKAAYQFNPRWQVTLGLENLLDLRYRPYSSGIAAAGRNMIVGLRAGF